MYRKTQLLSHPSLLKTFGFSAISTYDSYIPSIFGTNTLIWGTLDMRLNFKIFGRATFNMFDIILSDEPITGIDVVQAKSVFKVLFSLHHLMTKNRK